MQTPEFAESLQELIRLANQGRIALMCAEAVPWRCHRSLIADALTVRGIRTEELAARFTLLRPLPKLAAPLLPIRPKIRRSLKNKCRLNAIVRSPSRQNDRTDDRLQNI